MTALILMIFFAFAMGAALGSFLNVVIDRWPLVRKCGVQALGNPPSRCDHCQTPIQPWMNIPVLTWLALQGKASCCGAKIPARVVWVELAGGLLGALLVGLFYLVSHT